jgi:hypothetical protein
MPLFSKERKFSVKNFSLLVNSRKSRELKQRSPNTEKILLPLLNCFDAANSNFNECGAAVFGAAD